jgi:hypothetical protein
MRIQSFRIGEARQSPLNIQPEPGSNHQCIMATRQDRKIHRFSLPCAEIPDANRPVWG